METLAIVLTAAALMVSAVAAFRIPILRQIRNFVEYQKNTDKFMEVKTSLEATKMAVEMRIAESQRNTRQIYPPVPDWIQRADEKFKEMTTFKSEIQSERNWFACVYSSYKHSKKAKKIAEEGRKIIDEGSKFLTFDTPSTVSPTSFTGDLMEFESTRKAMTDVLEALKSDMVFIVGVYGMGGSGKTTLVKLLREKAKTKALFDRVVMVTVSQDQDVRRIQGQIADSLNLTLTKETDQGRADELSANLMGQKKILIILDDLWGTLKSSEIGIPISVQDLKIQESKILLTSRDKKVCNTMMCQKTIQLNLLSEADSWILFKWAAGTDFAEPPEFEKVGKKAVEHCGNLPIALVVVASALRGESMEEWEKATQELKASHLKIVDQEDKLLNCITFSYNFLKDEETKRYLLICCLFAEDINIRKEDVLRYGKGMGLFEGKVEDARRSADRHAKQLIDLHLLLEGDQMGCTKMHDVIRHEAIRISSGPEHAYKVQDWPTENFESYKAVSFMWKEIDLLQDGEKYTNLEMLLLQNNHNASPISEDFFQGKEALKVLDLSQNLAITKLPESIKGLTNLWTLSLKACKLTDVSAIGELKKLKILSLGNSGITALPEEFRQLTDLRVLDLNSCKDLKKIPPNVISELSRLEELYMQLSFAKWGRSENQGENASFAELVKLRNLTVLKIDVDDSECIPNEVRSSPRWNQFSICICRDKTTRSANLGSQGRTFVLNRSIYELPEWFRNFVSNRVENLWYHCCPRFNSAFEQDKERFSQMKSLQIEQCEDVTHLVRGQDQTAQDNPILKSLETLIIYYNGCFQEICPGELPEGSFGKLKFLRVQQCQSLVKPLLPSTLIKNLKNLERLEVDGNPVLKVFNFDELRPQQSYYLTRLRELKLNNLYRLSNIWNGPVELAKLNSLRVVEVKDCRLLTYIFPPALFQGLSQLEELYVENCPKLEKVILKDGTEGEAKPFPLLKKLSLICLPMLTTIYEGSETIQWPSLQHRLVRECPNFSNFQLPQQLPIAGDSMLQINIESP